MFEIYELFTWKGYVLYWFWTFVYTLIVRYYLSSTKLSVDSPPCFKYLKISRIFTYCAENSVGCI